MVPPGLAGIADLDPAPPARAVRRRRGARHEPGCLGSPAGRPDARLGGRWSRAIDALLRDLEAHDRDAARVRRPGRDAHQRGPRARTDDPPPRRATSRLRSRRDGLVPGPHLVPYLNRLADLLWVLARAAEQAESRRAPPSRPAKRRNSEETRNTMGPNQNPLIPNQNRLTPNQTSLRHRHRRRRPRRPSGRRALGGLPDPGVRLDVRRAAADRRRRLRRPEQRAAARVRRRVRRSC